MVEGDETEEFWVQQDTTNSEPSAEETSKEEERGATPPFGGGEGRGQQGEMGCGASKDGVAKPTPDVQQEGHLQGQSASKKSAEPEEQKQQAATAQQQTPRNVHTPGRPVATLAQSGKIEEQAQNASQELVQASKAEEEQASKAQEERDMEVLLQHAQAELAKDTSLDEQLDKLFKVLVGVDNNAVNILKKIDMTMTNDVKATQKKTDLADGLLTLGIGRNVDLFIQDLFNAHGVKDEQLHSDEFKDKVLEELQLSHRMTWLSRCEVLRDIAKVLPKASKPSHQALQGIKALDEQQITALLEGDVCKAVTECLRKEIEDLKAKADSTDDDSSKQNSKFCVDPLLFKAKYGGLEDFKKGVRELVGAPHPKVWDEIMKEHTARDDSKRKFDPGNYNMECCPDEEYLVCVEPKRGRDVSSPAVAGSKRKVKSLDMMRKLPLAVRAKLWKEELLSISLYTGPMFYKYNAVLRKFPKPAYDSCLMKDGVTYNLYPTTINALLSGMRKLMWVAPVPNDRFVYRGLGGMNLPETFFKQDEYGVRGGTEFGMMSTTTELSVAIQYTGGKEMPTVFKIGIGAVNRGAVLDAFSQYPEEKEVLFPPLSFLEVVGEITYMTTKDNKVVRVVPLEIIANLNSPLLEDLIGMRKKLYIDSFEHQAHNLERELKDLIATTQSEFCTEVEPAEKETVIQDIVRQFKEVLENHVGRPAKWYNDDGKYRSAVIEMLGMKENAMAVPFLSMVMYREWEGKQKQLRQANRMVSKDRSRALRQAFSDGSLRKTAAFDVCKRHGIVAEQLEERNEMQETPLIREAADGDARHVEWLLEAGADVHAKMLNKIGFSALNQAAYFGNASCIKQLLKFKADPCVMDAYGGTPLVAAALNGELECIRVLLEAADGKFFDESKPAEEKIAGQKISAPQNVKTLYIDKATFPNGSTPLMKAALNGHFACVRVLILAGAKKEITSSRGKNAKDIVTEQIAALKGRAKEIDTEPHEKCKQILSMTPDQIRKEDSFEVEQFDTSRKDSHIKAFENQALGLHRVIEDMTDKLAYMFDDEELKKGRETVAQVVVDQFKKVLDKHRKRKPKWYNDDGRYRSAVSEMLSMKENARAVPCLSQTMYKEWTGKQQFLRQAKRMVNKEQNRALREHEKGSSERQKAALELCEAAGIVTEYLEERNEMSETPLIQEAADGDARNVLLLLEAGADVEAQQENQIGFTAMNQAAYFGHSTCLRYLLDFKADINVVDAYGGTPLVAASLNGEVECVKILLENQANVNTSTQNLNSPLMKAALNGHNLVVRMLIVAGAETKDKNAQGESAMDLAQSSLLGSRSFTKTDGRAVCVFADSAAVSRHVCTIVAEVAKRAAKKQAKVNLLVSPSVAVEVLQSLKANHELLGSVNLFLTHRSTNDASVEQVHKTLSSMLSERIFGFSNLTQPEFEAKIKTDVLPGKGGLPVFDVVLLEAGPDGRCAGFLPNKQAIVNTGNGEKVVISLSQEKDGVEGYTISLDVLRNATRLLVLASGIDKKDVVAVGLGKRPENVNCPVSYLVSSKTFWCLDTLSKTQWDFERSADCILQATSKEARAAPFSICATLTSGTNDLEKRLACIRSLDLTPEEIRAEDWQIAQVSDSSRKDSHIKTFENQALALKRELEELIQRGDSEFCCEVESGARSLDTEEQKQQDIVKLVVQEFDKVLQSHKDRDSRWYNDDGKYRSAVIEMLSMKDNAKAVPRLTMVMYKEWKDKQSFLRQADRMVGRDRQRSIRDQPRNSDERKRVALETCKTVGLVMDTLEERNEMSETPLIREAADGHASSVLLLLEAGADVEAQQENGIGFTALNQAAYFGHPQVIQHLISFRADVDTFDAYGGTPLVAAALNGEIDCVQALTEAGADVNHKTTNGNTPLMKAAINGHLKCVKWLILKNADITFKNKKHQDATEQTKAAKETVVQKLKQREELLVRAQDEQTRRLDLAEPKRRLDLAEHEKLLDLASVKETQDGVAVGLHLKSNEMPEFSSSASSGVSKDSKLLTIDIKRHEESIKRFKSAIQRLDEVLQAIHKPDIVGWEKNFDVHV